MILLISPQSNSKSIKIERRFSPDIGMAWMDTEKIKEAVLNILTNAVDFSPEKDVIEISTRQVLVKGKPSAIQISIQDNGKGISAADMNNIFDPYFSTKHKSTIHTGTGLGLFIAYQNLEDHGGTIEVNSKVNQGAAFVLTLPNTPPAGLNGPEEKQNLADWQD